MSVVGRGYYSSRRTAVTKVESGVNFGDGNRQELFLTRFHGVSLLRYLILTEVGICVNETREVSERKLMLRGKQMFVLQITVLMCCGEAKVIRSFTLYCGSTPTDV